MQGEAAGRARARTQRTGGRVAAGAMRLAAALGALSCEAPPLDLVVDLRTDFVPAQDFSTVRVRLYPSAEGAAAGEAPLQVVESAADPSRDYAEDAVRIAELSVLELEEAAVRVDLLGPTGAQVVSRTLLVSLLDSASVTVLISQRCGGVECPQPGDPPGALTCLAGTCVDPRCSPRAPELCPDAECQDDAGCASGNDCRVDRCVQGICLSVLDPSLCDAGDLCTADQGCVTFRRVVEGGASFASVPGSGIRPWTHAAVGIGPLPEPGESRTLLVAVSGYHDDRSRSVTQVTVGGVPATRVFGEEQTESQRSLWVLPMDTGTEADVVVDLSSTTKNNGVVVLAVYTAAGVGLGTPECQESSSVLGTAETVFPAPPMPVSPRAIQIAIAGYSSADDVIEALQPQIATLPKALSETSITNNGNRISVAVAWGQAASQGTWEETFTFPGGPEDGHGWLTCVIPEPP